jgi:hypothetical protein
VTVGLLGQGLIQSARKAGRRWQATRSGLRREFNGLDRIQPSSNLTPAQVSPAAVVLLAAGARAIMAPRATTGIGSAGPAAGGDR